MDSSLGGNRLFRTARFVGRYTLALAAGGLFVWLSWNSQPRDTSPDNGSVLLKASKRPGEAAPSEINIFLTKPADNVAPSTEASDADFQSSSIAGHDTLFYARNGNTATGRPSTGPPSD